MTDACYLADVAGAGIGDVVELVGDEGRHAAVVKRTRVGESVLLTDGWGSAVRGAVVSVTEQGLGVQVEQLLSAPPRPHEWVVVQALAKGGRSDVAVEALTELGADRIVAWQAARSVVRWDRKAERGVAKWQATAREATKQSRRFVVPRVSYATTVGVVELIGQADLALVAHEEAETGVGALELPSAGRILLVVGPEGGIAPEELDRFRAAGARPVSLGDGVLRTSTAGLVGLAQLQLLAGLGSRRAG